MSFSSSSRSFSFFFCSCFLLLAFMAVEESQAELVTSSLRPSSTWLKARNLELEEVTGVGSNLCMTASGLTVFFLGSFFFGSASNGDGTSSSGSGKPCCRASSFLRMFSGQTSGSGMSWRREAPGAGGFGGAFTCFAGCFS